MPASREPKSQTGRAKKRRVGHLGHAPGRKEGARRRSAPSGPDDPIATTREIPMPLPRRGPSGPLGPPQGSGRSDASDGIPQAPDPIVVELRQARRIRDVYNWAIAKRGAAYFVQRRTTLHAVRLASYAKGEYRRFRDFDPEQQPIGVLDAEITIPDEMWARRIMDAARAWREHPGFGVFRDEPELKHNPTWKAVVHLFYDSSQSSATVPSIATSIRSMRKELGPATEDGDLSDTELELWAFFRWLGRLLLRRRPSKARSLPERRPEDSRKTPNAAAPPHPLAAMIHVEPSSGRTPDILMRELFKAPGFRLDIKQIAKFLRASEQSPSERIKDLSRQIVKRFPQARPFLQLKTGDKRHPGLPALWLSLKPDAAKSAKPARPGR